MYDPAIVETVGVSDFEDRFNFLKNDVTNYVDDVAILDAVVERRQFWLDYLLEINAKRPEAGGITISSIESAVFGGPANTGDAARRKMNKKAAPADDAQSKTDDMFAKAATSGGGDESGSGGLSAGGLAERFAAAGVGGGSGSGTVYDVMGFAGINPNVSSGGGSIGGARNRGGPAKEPTIVEPNGFIVWGYASDRDALQEYRDRLMESEMFIDAGVHMHVAEANEVSGSDLDNAQVGGRDVGAQSTSSSSGGKSDGGGISLNIGAGAFAGAGSSVSSSGRSIGEKITAFRIDLQFMGDPIPGPGVER